MTASDQYAVTIGKLMHGDARPEPEKGFRWCDQCQCYVKDPHGVAITPSTELD